MLARAEDGPTNVLLIEGNAEEARRLQTLLSASAGCGAHTHASLCVHHADRLVGGLQRLAHERVDVVLLDLMLPDCRGLKTLTHIRRQAPNVPVVLLISAEDEHLAVQAVQRGAEDYLVRGRMEGTLVTRALLYAMERQASQRSLTKLSLTDELTGLYNRHGFQTLSEHHLKHAPRTRGLLLLGATLDDLDELEARDGDAAADHALVSCAGVLRATFRSSDVIARLGFDRFAVVLLDATEESTQIIASRLGQRLTSRNTRDSRARPLSLRSSIWRFGPDAPPSIDELLGLLDGGRGARGSSSLILAVEAAATAEATARFA